MKIAETRLRYPIMALGLLALLAALWAGLLRLGWPWPLLRPTLPVSHGPLMVSGFLGTLIALERAVALRARWTYLGPFFSGLGALLLMTGVRGLAGPTLITLGSAWLVAIFAVIVRRHTAAYTLVMAAGAVCWLAGNLLWLSGWPVARFVFWWAGFLILTIAGERLELGRLVRLSRSAQGLFLLAAGVFATGLVTTLFAITPGTRITGAGMLALAAWLLRYDIARRTIRQTGLPRFAAACLLSGYVWLAAAGIMALVFGGVAAGPRYDALLHAIFLGYVFSMIFGHAPIILPAVLNLPVRFHPALYLHLAALHLSLLLRVFGDLANVFQARLWGGLLNAITLLLFLGSTVYMARRRPVAAGASSPAARQPQEKPL